MKIQKGDTVKDVYGDWHKVMDVVDNVIYTYDFGRFLHIEKVVKVVKGQ
jgi:hypothetical protein